MAVFSGPDIPNDGLVLSLDAANPKSFSPNVHPNPTDIYGWITVGNSCTLTRDNIASPVGSTPLKMVQTGNDPYTMSYSGDSGKWRLAPAKVGETWTVSVWVKASQTTQIDGCWVASLDASGNYVTGGATPNPTIGTTWTRISASYTHTNASTAYVGVRLDGTQSGGAGVTVWWDGLQVELASSATDFNPRTNTNRSNWFDISGNGYHMTLYNNPAYASSNKGVLQFNGTNQYGNIPSLNYSTSTFSIVAASRYSGATRGRIITAVGNNWLLGHHAGTCEEYYAEGWIADTDISDTNWRVYTATENYAADQRSLYVNGVSKVVNSTLGSQGFNQLSVGGYSTNFQEWSTGEVSFINVYNRILSQAEITQIYNVYRTRYGL